MSKAFNLTAQLNLAGPNNLKPIVSKIKRELGAIKADVKFNLDPKAAKSIDDVKNRLSAMNSVLIQAKTNANDLNATLRGLSASLSSVKATGAGTSTAIMGVAKTAAITAKNIKVASSQMEEFGKQSYLAIKRFAAFGVAAGGIYRLINAVTTGFKAFIEFDKQLVRLQQVTGDGSVSIQSLSKQITSLSVTLGVSSEKLTEVAVTLAQAGLSAKETEQALSALAKTELAPSFDDITETTEGAIAAMRQFGISTKDLEGALGSINSVAAAFAVESSDIITAIQRAGGAFAASSTGVSEGTDALNEFIAVFTSVRATTRESAETIATGLRTIFTRIQRPQTIEFLKEFGVDLTDLEGKFVGPYEAVKRLSSVLNKLDPRDLRFAQIVEELGGFRQISKVIPLIQQFAEAEKALKVAQEGQGSLTKAQEIAQQSLAVQLARVREEFLSLIKTVGQSDTFQGFFKLVLGLSSALIKLAGAFRPILPALAILGTIKGGKAIAEFGGGFLGSFKKGGGSKAAGASLGSSLTGGAEKDRIEATNVASEALRNNTNALSLLTAAVENLTKAVTSKGKSGGSTFNSGGVVGFATGGVVPGSGNRDTVPAMLTPGEFVIRKKAVEKLGADNLHKMNKYADGGTVNITAKELRDRSRGSKAVQNLIVDNADPSLYKSGKAINTNDNISFIRNAYKLYKPKLVNDASGFEDAVATKTNGTRTNYGKNDPNFPIDITGSNFGPLEVRNRNRSTSDRTLLDKLIRYYLSSGQKRRLSNQPKADSISLGKLGIVYNSAKYDPPNAKELNKGGPIQRFLLGGTVEETSQLENMTLQEAVVAWLKELGGIEGVKQTSGIPNGERTLNGVLRANNINSGNPEKLKAAIYAINKALANETARKVRQAQSINKMMKLGIVGLEPLGYSEDQPFDTKFGKAALLIRGLPNTPEYADAVSNLQGGVSNLGRGFARGLQNAALAKTKPLVLDFDKTLVDGADILDANGNQDIPAYSDLNKVKESLKNGTLTPLGEKLKSLLQLDPSFIDNIRILTARPQNNASLLSEKLNQLGLSIPANKITGISGGNKGESMKAGETLIDDDIKNIMNAIGAGKGGKYYASQLRDISDAEARAKGRANAEGAILELALSELGAYGGTIKENSVDFEQGLGLQAAGIFGIPPDILTEVKRTLSSAAIGRAKDQFTRYLNELDTAPGIGSDVYGISKTTGLPVSRFANGGSSQDTVPALLTPGEFVINKNAAKRIGHAKLNKLNKADKVQGFNSGGSVGYIQKFASGGSPDPRVIAAIEDAAKRAGMAVSEFEKQLKKQIINVSSNILEQRKSTRSDLRTDIIRTAAKGLGNKESQKDFFNKLQQKIKALNPSAKDSDINKAVKEIFQGIKSGKTFDEMLKTATTSLKPLNDALDAASDNTIALKEAQDQLSSEFGGLTDAIKVSIKELNAAEYRRSGQAAQDFGLAGDLAPEIALAFKQSKIGVNLLGAAKSFQNFGIAGLDETLSKLPGPIGDAVKAVGGIPGVIAGLSSMLADTLKNNQVFGTSVAGAGLTGALAGAGSNAISLGTLGQQLAGPIGGVIGIIGGGIGGAIDGFLQGSKIQLLENSMAALNENVDAANKALDNLAQLDNARNYESALKSVDSLRDNINELGYQAQSTLGEKSLSGLSGVATGGAVGTAAGAAIYALLPAISSGIFNLGASLAATSGVLSTAGTVIAGLGLAITSLPLTGIVAVTAGIAALGYGIYRFVRGTPEIDKQALEGQLKAIENYVKGLSQFTQRRIRLSSLSEIESGIAAYQNAITPQQKAELGRNSAMLQEAEKGAKARGVSAETAKTQAAIALAMQELNQIYAGNAEMIKKESKDKQKLLQRGLELAAEQSYQIQLQERMAIVMKEVNKETENLIELFDKMDGVTSRFNSELDASQTRLGELTDVMSGKGKMSKTARRDEDILKNASAYSQEEFDNVLKRIGELSGGGSNAQKLKESLSSKRIIEQELPGLLRNTTSQNIPEVTRELEKMFKNAGISSETTNALISQVTENLQKETQGRQGKSFKELANEFPALEAAMSTFTSANETATNILIASANALDKFKENLDGARDAVNQSFELMKKSDEIRLETALKLDEILGTKSGMTSADVKDAEIRRLTEKAGIAPTLDPTIIGQTFEKNTAELKNIRDQLINDPGNIELIKKESALITSNNNLYSALTELQNSTERSSGIMEKYAKSQELAGNTKDILRDIYTNSSEDNMKLVQQIALGAKFIKNPASIQEYDVENRKNAFAGLEFWKKLGLLTPQEENKVFLESLPEDLRKLVIARMEQQGKTFEDLFKTDAEKTIDALQEDARNRMAAVEALKNINNIFIKEYEAANMKLIEKMRENAEIMAGIRTATAASTTADVGAAATRTPSETESSSPRVLPKKSSKDTATSVNWAEKSGNIGATFGSWLADILYGPEKGLMHKGFTDQELFGNRQPAMPTNIKTDIPKPSTTPTGTPAAPTTTATVDRTTPPGTASASMNLLTIDNNTKTFLTEFQGTMNKFDSYVTRMKEIADKLPVIPSRIEMQGRHTVQVNITGDKVWASLESRMAEFIQGEVDKKMNSIWNKSGGELGSSGAGGSRVASRFDTQSM